jgi:hypothetical protein
MHALKILAATTVTAATLSTVTACASSGSGSAAQAGTATPRSNSSVLTAAEIATVPGIANAHDAVQMLRPQFLRTRGGAGRPAGMLGAGAEGALTGRRPGQVQGSGSGNSGPAKDEGSSTPTGRQAPEDPGILIYLDRQRYGRLQTLREIPVSQIAEIRFLNVGEANSEFGMGHPHGVIQILTKRGGPSQ